MKPIWVVAGVLVAALGIGIGVYEPQHQPTDWIEDVAAGCEVDIDWASRHQAEEWSDGTDRTTYVGYELVTYFERTDGGQVAVYAVPYSSDGDGWYYVQNGVDCDA